MPFFTHIYHALVAAVITTMAMVGLCAPATAEAPVVWTAPTSKRVMLTGERPDSAVGKITLRACRNEWESAQVIIRATSARLSQLRYHVTAPRSANGAEFPAPAMFQELDVPLRKSSPRAPLEAGWYPDALVPFANGASPARESFRGQRGQVNLRLWLDFHVPSDQTPGNYTAKLRVTGPAGKPTVAEAVVTVEVLPETLPDKPSLKSFFGLDEHRIARIHGLDRNKDGLELVQVMDRYYNLLADARVQPGLVFASSPPLDDDNKLVWSQPASATLPAPERIVHKYFGPGGRFNVLHLPFWRDYPFAAPLGRDRDAAVSYLARLAKLARETAPEADLLFSVGRLDEPDTAAAYQRIRKWASMVHEAASRAKTRIKFFVTEQPQPQNPSWGSLVGAVDIWAPHVMWAWEDLESRSGKGLIRRRIRAGDEVWCYPALAQFRDRWMREKGLPDMAANAYPPVWLTDYPAVHYRILPWICAAHGITGVHYWNTFEWPENTDPWEDAGSFVIGDGTFNGDGLLIYPPPPARLVGKKQAAAMQPCASIRLKWIRDGMEDYGHLQLLRQKNLAAAARIRSRVARGFSNWQTSQTLIDSARAAISKALKPSPDKP